MNPSKPANEVKKGGGKRRRKKKGSKKAKGGGVATMPAEEIEKIISKYS